MRAEPRWITKEGLVILHDRSLAQHGGLSGIRDEGLLESALARPQNRYAYEDLTDIIELAATYCVAVSSNHPFVDGNKRAAFLALSMFLTKNGLHLIAGPVDATLTIFTVAAGEMDIPALAQWLRANVQPGRNQAG